MSRTGNSGKLRTYEDFKEAYFNFLDNKSFTVCLSHDVDNIKKRHQYVTKFLSNPAGQIKSLASSNEPYWNFETIQKIENTYGVKSTFFFICQEYQSNIFKTIYDNKKAARYDITSPKLVNIIRDLDEKGWEIGVHGSFGSHDNIDFLSSEKKILEKIVGHEIQGIRQHYLNLSIPLTWQKQKEAGFSYDCSFGFNNKIGFKQNLFYPFNPLDSDFLVIPVSLMDTVLFHYHTSEKYWDICKNLVDDCISNHSILNIIWHQESFSEIDFPGYTEFYRKLIEYCISKGAKFSTSGEVAEHILCYGKKR